MRSKFLPVLLSFVLAFSLMGTSALMAFADSLSAVSFGTQATSDIVYDSVYGVFGGEYALMYKDVAYEQTDSDGKTSAVTGHVTDLVRADGEVMLHTSDVPSTSQVQPGGYTDLQIQQIWPYPSDISIGYVMVRSKETSKLGLLRTDGSGFLPCSYDKIQLFSSSFVCVSYTESNIQFDFFSRSGDAQGTVTRPIDPIAGTVSPDYIYVDNHDPYYVIRLVYYLPELESVSVHVKKIDSNYVLDSNYIVDSNTIQVYATDYSGTVSYGALLIGKSDDKVYYRAASGGTDVYVCEASDIEGIGFRDGAIRATVRDNQEDATSTRYDYYVISSQDGLAYKVLASSYNDVYTSSSIGDNRLIAKSDGYLYCIGRDMTEHKIAPLEGVSSYKIQDQFIALTTDLPDTMDSNSVTRYYNTLGVPLENVESNTTLWVAVNGYGLFGVEHDMDRCQIYAADGVRKNDININRGSHSRSSSSLYWHVLDNSYFVYQSETEFVDRNRQTGEMTSGNEYRIIVYNLEGSLKKDLGDIGYAGASLRPIISDGSTVGYELALSSSPSNPTNYYDLDFNELDSSPEVSNEGVSQSDSPKPSYVLLDGTEVFLSDKEIEVKNGNGNPVVVASGYKNVEDRDGNPIVVNGYTLSICEDSKPPVIFGGSWNSLKHGDADIWWATDSDGNWGAIDSTGAVKVPFQYEAYFDGGESDTDYALIKKDGAWGFVDVQTGAVSSMMAKPTTAPTLFVDAKVTAPAQTYTGAALTPDVTVTLAGQVLPKDAYDVSCPVAVNAGTYLITVAGKGDYSGTATGIFTVEGMPIPKSAVSGITSKTYTGKRLTQPKLAVKVGGKTLALGTDYEVAYKANRNAGKKCTVVVTGKGNYAGTVSKRFTILRAALTKASVKDVKPQRLKRDGKAVKPKLSVKYKGRKLVSGRDYKVVYKNCKKAGTAKAVLTGRGNFKGKRIVEYEIR